MRRSLRSTLLINSTCISMGVFVCVAIALFAVIRGNLWAEFDSLLAARARALAAMIEQDDGRIDIEFHEHPLHEFARQVRPEYYQVWSDDGVVLARSRRLGTADLPRKPGSLVEPGISIVTLPDDRRGRFAAVRFLPRTDGAESAELQSRLTEEDDDDDISHATDPRRDHVTLVIARDTEDVDRALTLLAWTLAGVLSTAVALTIGALAWIVTRNLRPLESLASQIGGTDVKSLSSRFALDDAPLELQPVVNRLNELLARMEDSFLRERSFSSNVAHELRTPLAGMRATMDVALNRARDTREYREALRTCQLICAQTQQLVCTLLEMARLESGRGSPDLELVDVGLALEQTWEPFCRRAAEREVAVTFSFVPGILLQTDARLVHLLFANLLDNAITYVDDGGWISIDAAIAEDGLQIEIANSGCRLTAEQQSHTFERFWRGDDARAGTGAHAGLGLALCRRIVNLLSATIEVQVSGSIFTARTRFSAERIEMVPDADPGVESVVDVVTLRTTELISAVD